MRSGVKILLIAFLIMHLVDFLTTFYMIHVNNPNGMIEEKNVFVKNIVEASPLSFTLLYALTNLYFMLVFIGFRWLENKTKKRVLPVILTILIGIKCFVLLNNFTVLFFVFFG